MGHGMLEVLVKLVFVIAILQPASQVMAADYIVGGAAGWGFVPAASCRSGRANEIKFVPSGDKLRKTHFKVSPL